MWWVPRAGQNRSYTTLNFTGREKPEADHEHLAEARVERHEPALEHLGVRRGEGSTHTTAPALEARRPHVQQVRTHSWSVRDAACDAPVHFGLSMLPGHVGAYGLGLGLLQQSRRASTDYFVVNRVTLGLGSCELFQMNRSCQQTKQRIGKASTDLNLILRLIAIRYWTRIDISVNRFSISTLIDVRFSEGKGQVPPEERDPKTEPMCFRRLHLTSFVAQRG